MSIILYRGDGRAPDPPAGQKPTPANSIRCAGGFQPRVATTLPTGRAIIQRCVDPRGPVPQLPPPANDTSLQTLLREPKVSLIDVLRNIKAEKSQRTVHVSTDTTIEAGGYATAYVYRMQFDLFVQTNGLGAPVQVTSDAQLASPVKANVFFNGLDLARSTLFGISGGPVNPGVEAAFLTAIPMSYITHYCVPGNGPAGQGNRPWIAF